MPTCSSVSRRPGTWRPRSGSWRPASSSKRLQTNRSASRRLEPTFSGRAPPRPLLLARSCEARMATSSRSSSSSRPLQPMAARSSACRMRLGAARTSAASAVQPSDRPRPRRSSTKARAHWPVGSPARGGRASATSSTSSKARRPRSQAATACSATAAPPSVVCGGAGRAGAQPWPRTKPSSAMRFRLCARMSAAARRQSLFAALTTAATEMLKCRVTRGSTPAPAMEALRKMALFSLPVSQADGVAPRPKFMRSDRCVAPPWARGFLGARAPCASGRATTATAKERVAATVRMIASMSCERSARTHTRTCTGTGAFPGSSASPFESASASNVA
mmetsp:Transcript_41511/g.120113  ORF Transcript_41511/g.120113 Transcript_41511/m.120113 type:complete len:334 (+) Transcript_41511:1351-2352(+)